MGLVEVQQLVVVHLATLVVLQTHRLVAMGHPAADMAAHLTDSARSSVDFTSHRYVYSCNSLPCICKLCPEKNVSPSLSVFRITRSTISRFNGRWYMATGYVMSEYFYCRLFYQQCYRFFCKVRFSVKFAF